jgi:hypothetical protein
MTQEPTTASDDLIAQITAKLDRAARLGQKILAPFLYVACAGAGILMGIGAASPHSGAAPWVVGLIGGVMMGWLLVRASYFLIKWALVVLGIYAVGSVF